MKITAIALLIIIAVIACGCTTPAPAAAPSSTNEALPALAIPDLTGTWTGPMTGYEPDAGFTNYGNTTMSMIVSEQQGRIFTGTFVFGSGNNTETIPFSGVIGRNGRTLTIPQKTGGYSFGEVISSGEIELIYVSDGTHYSSSIDMLRKA
ncbi:hypothetical protein [Methanoregula sp.]|uniref:hypothetical protein n=1 Tax=Methanoregula sp. TaxID=2052170 RepID=UPI000CC9564D|nr:hypothetical protein [Methanoregula sp.]PKG32754.1 MAG: hypothetical protein CW742_06500 [Methanoregula sp.]